MKKSVLLFCFFLTINFVFGQGKDDRLKGIDDEVNEWMKTYTAVGLSISIVENNRLLYSKGFGYRDLENKKTVNENTLFPIASCTKAFTASLLGILEAENKLSLKSRPSFYIPNLRFYNAEMDNLITIEDLLSHRSGLGNLDGTLVLFPENNRLKILEKLKYLKPEGKVRESNLYSNMGFTIAGAIVEQVTNDTWGANIQNKIFKPLEMTNSTTYLNTMKQTQNFSFGYGINKGSVEKVLFEEYFDYEPAGGIKSSAKDMANWMLSWLNNGKFKDKQVLPQDYIKTARMFHNPRPGDYEETVFLQGDGLGWRVEANDGDFKVYHGGNTSGFSSLVLTFPFKGLGITVLTNQENSILPYVIADIIKNIMLNKPKINRTDYPVIVKDIYVPSEIQKSLNSEKPTTHPLSFFVGTYNHKGYGDIEIKLEQNKLYAEYPTYKFFLEHLSYNIFVMSPIEKISHFNPEFAINFQTNNQGEISSFRIIFTKI
jgi:CubicO group peptidase (beta-lactamase class C family)